MRPERTANEMKTPGHYGTVATRRETGQRGRWYKPLRCSICRAFIWVHPIALKEPIGAPEPLQEWVLCQPCHGELLVEMSRSTIRSPVRLRIAMGHVAANSFWSLSRGHICYLVGGTKIKQSPCA